MREGFTGRRRGAGGQKTLKVVLGTFLPRGPCPECHRMSPCFRLSHGVRETERTLESLLPLSALLPLGGVTSGKSLNHALWAK